MELYLFWNMITGSQRIKLQAYFMRRLIQSQGSMKLEQNGTELKCNRTIIPMLRGGYNTVVK